MGAYDDYAERFLAALYLESEGSGDGYYSAQSIHGKYDFAPDKSHWVSRMADEWEHHYFRDVSKVLGGYDGWSFRISADGYRQVESKFDNEEEVRRFLGRPSPFVPASDRIVRLDHNQPEYQEIARGIQSLFELVRQDNEVGETTEERVRLLRSLAAAEELWSATELYLIQIRVGVALAVNDAVSALARLGKAVGAALLVDVIKRFVEIATGTKF